MKIKSEYSPITILSCIAFSLAISFHCGCSPSPEKLNTQQGGGCSGLVPLTPEQADYLKLSPQAAERLRALKIIILPQAEGEISILAAASEFCETDFELLGTIAGLAGIQLGTRGIDGRWLRHLASAKKLRSIHLSGVGSSTPCDLTSLSQLRGLEIIAIDHVRLTKESMAGIAGLPHLTVLTMKDCDLEDADLKPLAEAKELSELWLYKCPITTAGIAFLGKPPHLRTLSLAGTQIDDRAMELLTTLPSLAVLDIGETAITDAGCAQLPNIPKLRTVILQGSQATDRGVEALKEPLRGVHVIWK